MGNQRRPENMSAGYAQARMYAAMIAYMMRTPRFTYDDVMKVMGWGILAVRRYVNALHDEGLIRIVDFAQDVNGRRTIRVFAFGAGTDYAIPKRTANQYRQAKIERLREETGVKARSRQPQAKPKEMPKTRWMGGSPFSS